MDKKYQIEEEKPHMVSEPVIAVSLEVVHQNSPTYIMNIEACENERIARVIASSNEEYEDMKTHSFYKKGIPFPEQPQTWDDVRQSLAADSEDDYVDENEYNKAMDKLWSVLA